MTAFRRRVYEIVEAAQEGDWQSRTFDIGIMLLIILNVLALVVETVESVYVVCPTAFAVFETVSVAIFTVEYLLRVWSCVADHRYSRPVVGRIRHALTPMAMIDLLAIGPFYLPFLGVDMRFVRSVRLLRIFRVAKLGRYSRAVRTLGRVFRHKKEELGVTLFVLFLLLLIASCLMYFAEHDAQPNVFSSIPAAMWWGVATLTTVGYGDVFPVTPRGKLVASIIAVLGIGMFALPTGILGAGFVEEVQKRKAGPKTCPHCGKELTELQ